MCDSVLRIIFGQMRVVLFLFFLLLHFMHKCVSFGLSLTISAFSVIKFDTRLLLFFLLQSMNVSNTGIYIV